MVEVELHDEVLDWIEELNEVEWQRTCVIVDRLAALATAARMPFVAEFG